MANDKDFVVAGAVEVGKDTKVTLGSITSSDIDLATGNYFADTLAANTTYTISNAGSVQSFQLEVTGGSVGYDLGAAVYDSKSFSVASQDTSPSALYFKPDGTKMYVLGDAGDDVNEYTLSTAWDVSTATYSQNFNVNAQETSPQGLFFKPDGTKMYVVGAVSDAVSEYNLSTAWSVNTASYNQNLNVTSQTASPQGLSFKSDGTKMYVVGLGSIYQYSLSTGFDLSTASYDSVTLDVSPENSASRDIYFSAGGTTLVMVGQSSPQSVFKYTLSTAWDLSTASYTSDSFYVGGQDTAPYGMTLKPDGTKMYVIGVITDTVYQYSTATGATLTWPSSIEWAGGVAPSAPAVGETDVFTLVTDDGGTSYVGVKTADNLS